MQFLCAQRGAGVVLTSQRFLANFESGLTTGPRRRRGCLVDIPRRGLAAAAGASWIFRDGVAPPPRVPRGYSETGSRRSWIFREWLVAVQVVLDGNGELAGLLTERDFLNKLPLEADAAVDATVADLMTSRDDLTLGSAECGDRVASASHPAAGPRPPSDDAGARPNSKRRRPFSITFAALDSFHRNGKAKPMENVRGRRQHADAKMIEETSRRAARPRAGDSEEMSRGAAAAATWIFRGDESRRHADAAKMIEIGLRPAEFGRARRCSVDRVVRRMRAERMSSFPLLDSAGGVQAVINKKNIVRAAERNSCSVPFPAKGRVVQRRKSDRRPAFVSFRVRPRPRIVRGGVAAPPRGAARIFRGRGSRPRTRTFRGGGSRPRARIFRGRGSRPRRGAPRGYAADAGRGPAAGRRAESAELESRPSRREGPRDSASLRRAAAARRKTTPPRRMDPPVSSAGAADLQGAERGPRRLRRGRERGRDAGLPRGAPAARRRAGHQGVAAAVLDVAGSRGAHARDGLGAARYTPRTWPKCR